MLRCADTVQQDQANLEFSSLPDSVLNSAADSLYRLGEQARASSKVDSAIFYHKAALSVRESRKSEDMGLVYSHRKLGLIYLSQLKTETALVHLEKAMDLAMKHHAPADTMAAIYLNAAAAKRELMDHAAAISLSSLALSTVKSQAPDQRNLLSRCYRSLAGSYSANGSYEDAIKNLRQSIELLDPGRDTRLLTSIHFNMALAFRALGRYDSTMVNLRRAMRFRAASPGNPTEYYSSIYINMGDVLKSMGMPDSANYYFRLSLGMRQRFFGEKHLMTAGAYATLSEFYSERKLYDSSLLYRQLALRSLVKSFGNLNINANPSPASDESTMELVEYLIAKASTLKAASGNGGPDVSLLRLSVDTYLLADSVFSVVQRNARYDDPQLRLLEAAIVPYADVMEVVWQLYDLTQDRGLLETALQVMERSKAVVLKKALSRLQSFHEFGISRELLLEENQLFQRRSELVQSLMLDKSHGRRQDSISEEIVRVDARDRELREIIASRRPIELLAGDRSAITLKDMMKVVRSRRSLWIEYMWTGSDIYVMSIGTQSSRLTRLPITAELVNNLKTAAAEVQSFNDKSIDAGNFLRFTESANWLYKILLEPLLQDGETKNLIICASGPLMSFPFEALILSKPTSDEVDYRLNYVVNTFDVSYQYSSALLTSKFGKSRNGDKLLAVGYSGLEERTSRNQLGDLPGSRAELAAIREVMSNSQNRYLVEKDASEAEFKRNAERFNLLHLAIHGISDTTNVMNSRLIFPEGGDVAEDGSLFAHELYALDLRGVDLAVLSACESGIGKIQAGEGMMSIARGFSYAGCPSLVISMWKIDDRASAVIMSDFYNQLSRSERVDRSLAEAKRTYLSGVNVLNSHPSFWAAFMMVGETSAVSSSMAAYNIYLIGAGVLAAIILVVFAWKKIMGVYKPVREKSGLH